MKPSPTWPACPPPAGSSTSTTRSGASTSPAKPPRRCRTSSAAAPSLHTPTLDTRFLGDLYQDLSDHARATYALLQTPEFVEEFILDRTFEPAVREFGLAATSVIDPTCGSGHFLLGAFGRLVQQVDRTRTSHRRPRARRTRPRSGHRRRHQPVRRGDRPLPTADRRPERLRTVQSGAGADTSRSGSRPVTRCFVGVLKSSHQGDLLAELEGRPAFAYYTEDGDLLADYLEPGQYTVVVGNPPYITVKDKVLNERYRKTELHDVLGHVRDDGAVRRAVLRAGEARRPRRRRCWLGRPDHRQLVHETRVRQEAHQ